mgnify:FL=1
MYKEFIKGSENDLSSRFKILIVEDELDYQQLIKKHIELYFNNIFYDYEIKLVSEDFTNYENYKNAQVVFLDICLKSYNGIEIATKLKKKNSNLLIIFISNINDLVFDAFIALPFFFIRKNCFEKDFENMGIQLKNFIDRHMKILELRINGRITKIHINEIIYVEAMLRKVRIVTIDQEIIYKSSFSNFLKLYSNRTLIQTQRSYAVNISQVKSVGSSDILLSNNEYLPISEKYKKNFIEQYKKIIYFKFNT